MDEDEYVAKVEKIIERDFFPELDKLKAQSDYIDARERKDYETMSRLEEIPLMSPVTLFILIMTGRWSEDKDTK